MGLAVVPLAALNAECSATKSSADDVSPPWPYGASCYATERHTELVDTPLIRITGSPAPDLRCPPSLQSGSVNDTPTWADVRATDLGFMWDSGRGHLMIAFGDTYGAPWKGPAAGAANEDWRHNFLARSVDADSLELQSFVTDAHGRATEMIERTPGIDREDSVIPTAGVSIGTRDYVHFMSVRRWTENVTCPRWQWVTNYSAFAFSDDDGQTFTRADWVFATDSHFAEIAMVRDEGKIYLFGTPAGRIGGVALARVSETALLNRSAYEFYANGMWTADEHAATEILPGPVAELSIIFHPGLGKWLMSYLSHDRNAIVLRAGGLIAWGDEVPVIDTSEDNTNHPRIYGGFMSPWITDETSVQMNVSKITCYGVFATRVPLPAALLTAP